MLPTIAENPTNQKLYDYYNRRPYGVRLRALQQVAKNMEQFRRSIRRHGLQALKKSLRRNVLHCKAREMIAKVKRKNGPLRRLLDDALYE